MVKIWLFNDNVPSVWTSYLRENIRMDKGKKVTEYFTNAIANSSIVKSGTIPEIDTEDTGQTGNTHSFLQKVYELLEYRTGQHINTVSLYQHPDYNIQAMYIINKDSSNSTDINHFATITNIENMQIYGKAVFFKIQNNLTVDLPLDDLLNLFVNFYYVNGCRLCNGKFETISFNNYVPEIQKMFASYKRKNIETWTVLAETDGMLNSIKKTDNKIEDLNNVVWFKVKEYIGEVVDIMSTLEHNKDSDYRGVFMDIDETFVRRMFF